MCQLASGSVLCYFTRMSDINTINFKGLYYAKSAIFANEIRKGVKPYLLDPFPNNLLKNVIETSPIFNDLKTKTDVYVSSYTTKNEDSLIGYIRAIFKDPYCKECNKIDAINLEANGDNEAIIFEKLKNIANKLPIYNTFNLNDSPLPWLLLGKNGSDGFVQRNLKI